MHACRHAYIHTHAQPPSHIDTCIHARTHTHTHAYRCQLCGGRGRTRSRWYRQSLCWSLPSCCGGLSRAGSAQENTRNQNGRTWHRVMVTQMEPRGQMCRLCLVPVPAKKLRRRSSRSSRRQVSDGEADLGLTSGVSLSLSLFLYLRAISQYRCYLRGQTA